MKKYYEIGKTNFQNSLVYYAEFFFKAVFIMIILFIFTNLWKTVYGEANLIEGYTIGMMIWYLLMTESIVSTSSGTFNEINEEVQSGEIVYRMNKPYSYVGYHYAKALSKRIIGMSIMFIIGSIIVYLMVGGIKVIPWTTPLILITVLLAITIDFLIIMPLALLAFWLEDTTGFRWVYEKLVFTIGGMLVPLEIFPQWLAKISSILPFSYIAYHPAKLFVKFTMKGFLEVAGIQILYVIVLGTITAVVYTLGTKKLSINGG